MMLLPGIWSTTKASGYTGHQFESRHEHFRPHNLVGKFFVHVPAFPHPSPLLVSAVDLFCIPSNPLLFGQGYCRTFVRAPVRNECKIVFLGSGWPCSFSETYLKHVSAPEEAQPQKMPSQVVLLSSTFMNYRRPGGLDSHDAAVDEVDAVL